MRCIRISQPVPRCEDNLYPRLVSRVNARLTWLQWRSSHRHWQGPIVPTGYRGHYSRTYSTIRTLALGQSYRPHVAFPSQRAQSGPNSATCSLHHGWQQAICTRKGSKSETRSRRRLHRITESMSHISVHHQHEIMLNEILPPSTDRRWKYTQPSASRPSLYTSLPLTTSTAPMRR